MAYILGIGIATLDIINTVASYPAEDDEVRALAQRVSRGGNATNTLTVLGQLGHQCVWGGVLVAEPDGERIRHDLVGHGIDVSGCRTLDHGKMPVSYITVSAATGSRSIVHFRDLPEFGFEDFRRFELGSFDWIHFEGRCVAETENMLRHLREHRCRATISVEVEKPRPEIHRLLPFADVLFFSRAYARHHGYGDAVAFLQDARGETRDADLVCAWGAEGAACLSRQGEVIVSPAHPPPRLVDTLGAGDTFNAGVIDARLRGLDWPAALEAANRLAGRKCGQVGLENLNVG